MGSSSSESHRLAPATNLGSSWIGGSASAREMAGVPAPPGRSVVRSCRGSHEEAIPTHALPRGAPMLAPMADDGGGHASAHTPRRNAGDAGRACAGVGLWVEVGICCSSLRWGK